MFGVNTLCLQKTNALEKGLGTVFRERQIKKAISHYLKALQGKWLEKHIVELGCKICWFLWSKNNCENNI